MIGPTWRGRVLHDKEGKRYTGDGFSANWQRLMKKAKVIERRLKFKDLRAKAAQKKADAEGLQAAQDLMGHTAPAITKKHYVARLPAIESETRPVTAFWTNSRILDTERP